MELLVKKMQMKNPFYWGFPNNMFGEKILIKYYHKIPPSLQIVICM